MQAIYKSIGTRYLQLAWAVGIVLLCLVGERATAQKIEIGASVGGLNYKGDIAPDFNFRFFRPGGSLFFRYNLSRSVTFRAEGLYGGIKGDDQYSDDPFQQARNLSFRTRITEANLVTEYNFLDYVNRRSAINWTPYVFGGIGYMGFKPTPQTSPYSTKGWVLPFGVGVKYQIRRPWNVGLEVGTRKTFTDHLDNLGGENLSANKLDHGDPSRKDTYYYVGFSVSYTFYRIVCPE
ncbi:type IX secretion system protein PorG [Telluribacter humicola]|uniref:type IX secretion system protein PorG n=1 Tax=Telluribacter humicola TaxID=1720261 RepID=UPI001E40766D|nr:DUF6089 family protein [Telluribacter humicola]